MKSRIPYSIKFLLLFFALSSAKSSYSALYTATSSGVWSDNSIWLGGTAPSYNNQLDQITIASGITVTLDGDYDMNGLLASLTINGTLTSYDEKNFFITKGTLGGGGSIDADNVQFGAGAIILFTGAFQAEDMEYSMLTLNLTTALDISKSIRLSDGTLNLGSGSSLNLSNDATLILSGGSLTNSGGGIFNGNKYNVTYLNLSSDLNAGAELQGSGLHDVTFDQGSDRSILLQGALTVKGKLYLKSGTLDLNDYDLELNDVVSGGNGDIRTTSKSSISITSSSSLSGTLRFKGNNNSMDNFILDLGNNNNDAKISGHLKINGTLTLKNGNLILDGSDLDIAGNVSASGNGTLSSSSNNSNIRIISASSISGALRFHNTNHRFKNFDVNITDGGSISLGSDLEISGMLTLSNGDLNIEDHHLILSGNIAANGNGRIGTKSTSDLSIKTSSSVSGKLRFKSASNSMRNFLIDIGDNNDVTIGDDITITGTLTLSKGRLVLDANTDLELSGSIANSGSGSISSSKTSNIRISSSTSLTGQLRFTDNYNDCKDFDLNIVDNGSLNLGSDLKIHGTLTLTKGNMHVDKHRLTIKGDIASGGSGRLVTNSNSDITVNTSTSLSNGLRLAGSSALLNDLEINILNGGSYDLDSDLEITGMLTLTLGTLNVNNYHLTLSGNLASSGTGSIGTTSGSDITLKTTSSFTGKLRFKNSSNTMRNLTIHIGDNNNATLANNLKITGMLSLTSGRLVLDQAVELELAGTLSNSGTGSLSSTNSNITVNTATSMNGILRFTSNSNSVNNFSLNIADGSNLDLGSDLAINGTLKFTSGRLNINDHSLKLGTSGTISGYSDKSYIITGVSGSLSIGLAAGSDSSRLYPVGTNDRYFPARIKLNSGSGSGNILVGVRSNVYADGNSGNDVSASAKVVDGTWNIFSDISTNLNLNLEVMWSGTAEVNGFSRSSAYISHYTNGSWDKSSKIAAKTEANGMFSIRRDNITSLSPFAVYEDAAQTGVEELSFSNIRVYPNPAVSTLFVDQMNDLLPIQLMNANGQVISNIEAAGTSTGVDIGGLPSGVYFIKVGNAVGKFTKM